MASSLHFTGTNNFFDNVKSGNSGGGAICIINNAYNNVTLTFNGANNFIGNSAYRGGAIRTSHNVVLTFIGNNFLNNSAGWGGAFDIYDNVVLTFNGNNITEQSMLGLTLGLGLTVDCNTFRITSSICSLQHLLFHTEHKDQEM